MSFVELSREFSPYSIDQPGLVAPSLFAFRSEGLRWPDLLRKHRVVVVAEAYSGKSAEFRATQSKLSDEGKPAFFIPIEQLCDHDLDSCIPPALSSAFESWKAGADDAYFFLDSIDEARLLGKTFRDALLNLSNSIRDELDRARIFISSRPNDWKAISDDGDVETWLRPLGPEHDDKEPEPSRDELLLQPILNKERVETSSAKEPDKFATALCTLEPLNSDQRKRLIEAHLSCDTSDFESEIGKFGLAHLATRPGDLLMLIGYWKTERQLDRREAMCGTMIKKKLAEYRSRDPLSDEKAFEGAQTVAAAMTFCRTYSILAVNHGVDVEDISDSIAVDDLLPNWTTREQESLLNRGIFTPYAFGKLRFYHREAQEFLCAKWLEGLLRFGCPIATLDRILFPEVGGITVVNPLLKPVAAWLALWNQSIQDKLITLDAALLIDHGDPGSLSPSVKAALLKSYADQMNSGQVAMSGPFSRFDKYCWLFADPSLASDIRNVWTTATDNSLRIDLLQMIEDGAITECTDIAEGVALNRDERIGVRSLATDALVACQANDSLRKLADDLYENRATIRADHAASLSIRLYGEHLTTEQLFWLIEQCPKPPDNVADGFGFHVLELWSRCPIAERQSFVRLISSLVLKPPFFSDYRLISSEFRFLTKQLPSIANDYFQTVSLDDASDEAFDILHAIARTDRFDSAETDLEELKTKIQCNAAFKRTLLWKDADLARRQNPETKLWHWRIPAFTLIGEMDLTDLQWLKEDLRVRLHIEDKLIALRIIVHILARQGDLESAKSELDKLTGDDSRLQEELESYLRPPDTTTDDRITEHNAKYAVERAKREQELRESWINFRNKIVEKPDALLDEEYQGQLIEDLTTWLSNKSGQMRRHTSIAQWRLLKAVFSEQVADNFQLALKSLWRRVKVNRPVRKGNESTFLISAAQAFAGVGVEAASVTNWAQGLSKSDATKAAQIACESEFDYPDWLDDLIEHRPSQALPAVRKALQYELETTEEFPHVLIQRYKSPQNALPAGIEATITDVTCKSGFGVVRRVEDIIRIVLRCNLTAKQRRRIAKRAVKSFHECDDADRSVLKARYLGLWIAVDPERAVAELESWLESIAEGKATQVAVEFFGNGFGSHGTGFLSGFPNSAAIKDVEKLAIIAHRHVKSKDDRIREGHFTPGIRDAAQSARGTLVSQLGYPPTREGLAAILRLAESGEMRSESHWLKRQARSVAEQLGNIESWSGTLQDFSNFDKKHFQPIASGDDLYRLACNLLSNICHDLKIADSSSKHLLQLLGEIDRSNEKAVQNWLAEQLRFRSSGRFQVPREQVVAMDNMPDVVIAKAPNEVAIEVKQADSWTIRELEAALENQLAETYMLPQYRRHGILFLTNNGRKKRWRHPETNGMLNYPQLLKHLSGLAESKASNSAGAIKVSVVGVDLAVEESN